MSDGTIRIAFLDVGQGDTIVISLPEQREAVVVDCVDAKTVFDYLKAENISTIRALVLTHLHADHYRDATAFLDNCANQIGASCEKLILNPLPAIEPSRASLVDDDSDSDIPSSIKRTIYQLLHSWMLRNRNPLLVDVPHPTVELPISGPLKQRIQFLYPFPAYLPVARASGFNNSSIVLRVMAGRSTALLTGDLEPEGWRILKRNPVTAQLATGDVLKFPHHGAWRRPNGHAADAKKFLDEVGAKTVVISVGTEQKKYSHPNGHVFKAIRQQNVQLLCTEATKKCGGAGVLKSRVKTVSQLETQAESRGRKAFLPSRGCPCGGTVIIDLDSSVRILQPDTGKHRADIVQQIFAKRHQCPV